MKITKKKIWKFINKHSDEIDKTLKFMIYSGIVILIFLTFLLPSYNSVRWAKERNILNNPKIGGYYNSYEDKIGLNKNSTISLRHELTHREQAYEGRLSNELIGSFVNELEAYIEQYFIWRKVNLTTLDWENE
jgi:hypothetical protein